MDFLYTLKRPDGEIDITVTGQYCPAYDGGRDEPSEPAHFEIEEWRDDDGEQIDLTDEECREIEEAGADIFHNRMASDLYDRRGY